MTENDAGLWERLAERAAVELRQMLRTQPRTGPLLTPEQRQELEQRVLAEFDRPMLAVSTPEPSTNAAFEAARRAIARAFDVPPEILGDGPEPGMVVDADGRRFKCRLVPAGRWLRVPYRFGDDVPEGSFVTIDSETITRDRPDAEPVWRRWYAGQAPLSVAATRTPGAEPGMDAWSAKSPERKPDRPRPITGTALLALRRYATKLAGQMRRDATERQERVLRMPLDAKAVKVRTVRLTGVRGADGVLQVSADNGVGLLYSTDPFAPLGTTQRQRERLDAESQAQARAQRAAADPFALTLDSTQRARLDAEWAQARERARAQARRERDADQGRATARNMINGPTTFQFNRQPIDFQVGARAFYMQSVHSDPMPQHANTQRLIDFGRINPA